MRKFDGRKWNGHGLIFILKFWMLFFVVVEMTESRTKEYSGSFFHYFRDPPTHKTNQLKRGRSITKNQNQIGVVNAWNSGSHGTLPLLSISEDPENFEASQEVTTSNEIGLPKQWLELESNPTSRVSAKLHSEVILECIAVGSPPPVTYWLKDGKPIDTLPTFNSEELLNGIESQVQSTSSEFAMSKIKTKLPIRCIRPEDEGMYTCVATQADTTGGYEPRHVSSTSYVVIDEDDKSEDWKPECEFRLPPYITNGKKFRRGTPAYIHAAETIHMEVIGNNIILPCRYGGKPKPRLQWIGNDGNRIIPGKKYQINTKGDLIIRTLSWNEMGDYKCIAKNAFGNESVTTFLYPLLPEGQ